MGLRIRLPVYPGTDLDTRVADLFLLGAITCPQQPECCFQIHDRKNRNLTGIFRANRQLEGKPDCELGDQKHHDFWSANRWRILGRHVRSDSHEHVREGGDLTIEGTGSVKGEPAWPSFPVVRLRRHPCRGAASTIPGIWGDTHKIHYDDQCNSLHFVPNAPGKEDHSGWDSALESFVNESDPTDTKTPGQLSGFAGIVLKGAQKTASGKGQTAAIFRGGLCEREGCRRSATDCFFQMNRSASGYRAPAWGKIGRPPHTPARTNFNTGSSSVTHCLFIGRAAEVEKAA